MNSVAVRTTLYRFDKRKTMKAFFVFLHIHITIVHKAIIMMTRTNTITIIHNGISHLTFVDTIGGLVEYFDFVIVAIVVGVSVGGVGVFVGGIVVVGDGVRSHLTKPSRKGSVQ